MSNPGPSPLLRLVLRCWDGYSHLNTGLELENLLPLLLMWLLARFIPLLTADVKPSPSSCGFLHRTAHRRLISPHVSNPGEKEGPTE